MIRFLLIAFTAVTISACLPLKGEGVLAFVSKPDASALAKHYGQAEAAAVQCGRAVDAREFRALAKKELSLMAKDQALPGESALSTWGPYSDAYAQTVPLYEGKLASCDEGVAQFDRYLVDVRAAVARRAEAQRAG